MLMDNRKKSEIKIVNRKGLLNKYAVKQEDNEISRYVMPDDIKEKINNLIAAKNTLNQSLKH